MLTSLLTFAGFVPLVGAALAALVCRLLGVAPRATWAWSVTAGVLSGQVGWKSRAGYALAARAFSRPAEAADWLPIILLLAIGISLLLIVTRPAPWKSLVVLAALFCVAVPLRLISGNVQVEAWTAISKMFSLGLVAALFGLSWLLLAADGEERSFLGRALATAVVAAVMAIVLTQSGVLVYGIACGAVAASLGGTAVMDFLLGDSARGGQRFTHSGFTGAAGAITFSLGSLIVLGLFFANLSALNAVLLLVALLAAGGPLPRAMAIQPLWLQLAVRALLCSVPLAVAVVSVLD
jgi:hypothetical protein